MIDLLIVVGMAGAGCVMVGAFVPPVARSSRLVVVGAGLLAVFVLGVLRLAVMSW